MAKTTTTGVKPRTKLRKARELLGFSVTEMAKACGYKDIGSYTKLEAGVTSGVKVNQKIVQGCIALRKRAIECGFDGAEFLHTNLCPHDFPSKEVA